jgi:hypothetical protein
VTALATISWETELAGLLGRLTAAQRELLALLAAKRDLLIRRDHVALNALAEREALLSDELKACHDERERILMAADAEGLPHSTLADLAASLPSTKARRELVGDVAEARQRASLIRNECLAQWVAVQRTVLHLAQMLEIIATGGRMAPTYGKGQTPERGGALMDQAV